MSLTRKKAANVNTSSAVKAANRARTSSSAAATNAANAAQNAALGVVGRELQTFQRNFVVIGRERALFQQQLGVVFGFIGIPG